MINNRLLSIASLVKKNSIVIDIGTDHAYLPIYLVTNNICKRVIASDISENALKIAKTNIIKYKADNIKLCLSDGLKSIEDDFDTIVISGMGTSSIKKILSVDKLPNKIIISSNNDLFELRTFMNSINYKIIKEIVVCENDKYYDIISYEKGKEHLSKKYLLYGKSDDKNYYKYLLSKMIKVYKQINFTKKLKKIPSIICLYLMTI